MKVLHVCPLWYPVSADSPGGIETFVAQLVPELQELGCTVTLAASGDSCTTADLIPVLLRNLNDTMIAGDACEYIYYEQHQLQLVLDINAEYDIVHSHVGAGALLLSGLPETRKRVLHSIHWPLYGDLEWFVRRYPDIWLSTVSDFQARKLREAGAARCSVIHNGIDSSKFTFRKRGSHQLLFVGRMERVKGADIAVRVARQLNLPLTLAGAVIEQDFFDDAVKPALNDKIRYVGVLNHKQKTRLFGEAGCVILPFKRDEPFGIVAIEAMACGTPVVALARGAVPEIIRQGITGFCTENERELPSLVYKALQLDRAAIHAACVEQFDISVAAEKYFRLYREIKEVQNIFQDSRT